MKKTTLAALLLNLTIAFGNTPGLAGDQSISVKVTFTGLGRLNSFDDEMAKPLCNGDTINSGQYLIHYNRIGERGDTKTLYPFFIYVPAEISPQSQINFLSCTKPETACSKATIPPGRRLSRMQIIENSGYGEHLVIVGGTPYLDNEAFSLAQIEQDIQQLNVHLLDSAITTNTKKLDLKKLEKTFQKILSNGYASRKFNVIRPGPCHSL